jgi:trk system potassium uptake protein TrkH
MDRPPSANKRHITSVLYREQTPRGWYRHIELSPSQLTLLGFALLIALGALFLSLPIARTDTLPYSFLTAVFTSTSAVCVTGLNVIDPSTYYTVFGQVTIMLLIQIGGLGYMTLYSLMLLAVGKRLSLRDRLALQSVLELPGPGGVVRFVMRILRFTLIIEGLGFVLLAFYWVPLMGPKGLYYALFHAISAFNNAGFALYPDNLMQFRDQPGVMLPICLLIILGGLGYPIISELWSRWCEDRRRLRWRYLSLGTRIGLLTTGLLLFLGTFLFLALEGARSETLGTLSGWDRLMSAFTLSVMPRTAGFNALDIATLTHTSLFVTILLMFVGSNPGGTGGGVKTTTVFVLMMRAFSVLQGHHAVNIYQRRLGDATINKATSTFFISLLWVNMVTLCLTLSDPKQPFLPLLFETVSAFATVGLSANLTPQLSGGGQWLIIVTMYVGRVGMITLGTAIWSQRHPSMLKYPEEGILVG